MKEPVFKLSLIPKLFVSIVKLAVAMHLALVPVSDVSLPILMLVKTLTLPDRLFFVFFYGDSLTDVASKSRLFIYTVRVP